MKVDDAVANAFVKEGTTDIFGLLGDSQMKWWAAMSAAGARMIDARYRVPLVAQWRHGA